METNEAKEVAGFNCPKCGAPGITLQTALCPNCHVLFKAAKDIPFDPRTEISADARHIASPFAYSRKSRNGTRKGLDIFDKPFTSP